MSQQEETKPKKENKTKDMKSYMKNYMKNYYKKKPEKMNINRKKVYKFKLTIEGKEYFFYKKNEILDLIEKIN